MTCAEVQSLLAEHAIGGVPDPLGRSIDTHLVGCAVCRQEYLALRHVCTLLDETPAPQVQLDPGQLRDEAWQRERRRARRWRRLGVAALAASVLLGVFAVLPRLEVRLERERLVIAWGAQPAPAPAPQPPPRDDERLDRLQELVLSLALDAQKREAELEQLRRESTRLRVSTEQDVSLLTRILHQSMREKGELP